MGDHCDGIQVHGCANASTERIIHWESLARPAPSGNNKSQQ
jgi:hypothetical protein